MGTETAEVRVPSATMPGAQPAATGPEVVKDIDALPWHDLRRYAKSIGVSLTEDSKIMDRAKLTVAVRARQAEIRPDQYESDGDWGVVPPSEGGPAPVLAMPGPEPSAVDGQPITTIDLDAKGHVLVDDKGQITTVADKPAPDITCIGCGKAVDGLPVGFDPTAQVLCLECDAARAAVLTAAAQRGVKEEAEKPAISDEELDKLLLDEPSLVADQPMPAKQAVAKEPPGDGPWQLWSPFGSLNPIVRQARSAIPGPYGGEIPRVSGLSVQFVNHEATVKDKALMRFLMQMASWDRREMRFKNDILAEGLVTREADLIIDKARARGLAIPDRDSLMARIAAETSGSAPLPDRTSRGVTPSKGDNTPGLNYGAISTRPTAPARTGAVTRGPLGSGADIEILG